MKKILVIGYGNPGRLDDGLGPAFVAEVERRSYSQVEVDSNYQLTVEDAASLKDVDVVVFADASTEGDRPFAFTEIEAEQTSSFTSHHLKPQAVLHLASEMYGDHPKAYLMAIRGYEYNEFEERLSEGAHSNLAEALKFFDKFVGN